MEEKKPKRTIAEVQADYSRLCTQAGHIQYNLSVMTSDLKTLNEQLKDLNFEAAKISNEEKAAAEAAAKEPANA